MNVLITGGAGFIGSHVAMSLYGLGHHVTILDSLTPQIHGPEPSQTSALYRMVCGKARIIRGSVCDLSSWKEAIPGQNAIIHLAAETGTGQSMYDIKRYSDVNVGGTALMLDVLVNEKHDVTKVVLASSRAIYGEGKYHSEKVGIVYPEGRLEVDLRSGRFDPICPESGTAMQALPTDEQSKIHPTSVYGITKLSQEQMVLTVCRSIGLTATSLRYQNVFGPGQSLTNPYTGILSIFSTRILNGNPIQVFEDGNESRDFIFIDDVVEATVSALFRESSESEAIGIGSGVPTSVVEVARVLLQLYKRDVAINVTGAFRLGDIRHNYADTQKARKLLAFQPKFDFRSGIERFANWVMEQSVPTDQYQQSVDEMKSRNMFKTT